MLALALILLLGAEPAGTPAATGSLSIHVSVQKLSVGSQVADAQSAVVFLQDAPAGSGPALPKGPFELASVKKRFEPALLIVPVGAVVSFPNRDKVLHNVYSGSDAKKFHLGLYGAGIDKEVTFDQPGVVNAFCNIHPQMAATILVMSNGFFAHPDEKGDVTFTDVPAGTWQAAVWFPFGTGKVLSVTVPAGKKATAEAQVIERPDPRRHTKEDGSSYGGY